MRDVLRVGAGLVVGAVIGVGVYLSQESTLSDLQSSVVLVRESRGSYQPRRYAVLGLEAYEGGGFGGLGYSVTRYSLDSSLVIIEADGSFSDEDAALVLVWGGEILTLGEVLEVIRGGLWSE